MSEKEGFLVRTLKSGDEIWADAIRFVVMKTKSGSVQVGIQAPKELKIETVKRRPEGVQ